MSLIKQNVIMGCVNADGKWPDVSKPPPATTASSTSVRQLGPGTEFTFSVNAAVGCIWNPQGEKVVGEGQGCGQSLQGSKSAIWQPHTDTQTYNVRACKGYKEGIL